VSRSSRRRSKRGGVDPVAEFHERARWSSFTNSWRFLGRQWGWHWPLKARQLLAVLFVGALVGAAAWVLVAVLRAFA